MEDNPHPLPMEEVVNFWENIWRDEKTYNENADWIRHTEEYYQNLEQAGMTSQ